MTITTESLNNIITISRGNIIKELDRESSLVSKGAYTKDGESLYDIVHIKQQEIDALKNIHEEAISNLVFILREHVLPEYNISSDSLFIAFNKSIYPLFIQPLTHDITLYIVSYILYIWLKNIYPDKAQIYEARMINIIREINNKLYYKNPPTRRQSNITTPPIESGDTTTTEEPLTTTTTTTNPLEDTTTTSEPEMGTTVAEPIYSTLSEAIKDYKNGKI